MKNGSKIIDEIEVADAHPSGKRPFMRSNYIKKFNTLTKGLISDKESKRFLDLVQNLKLLKSKDLKGLNVELLNRQKNVIKKNKAIFF